MDVIVTNTSVRL